ncbi:MAG: dihydroorotate dehydrogenase [Anaerolineae bacterium]|nr:dihydroorotate dehydrogenase [Anaerolineae bacterium]
MIELAPYHKTGLNLASPVLIASGFGGYGPNYQRLIDLSVFGALVTLPITLRPERGTLQPRLGETTAGFVLDTGLQNPGVRKVISTYRRIWPRLGTPVIAHLPADQPDDLTRTARALAGIQTPQGDPILAAIELGLPLDAAPDDVAPWLDAVRAGCELPILVKLPLGGHRALAESAVQAQADALVLGTPPLATALSPIDRQSVHGHLFGAALHSLVHHDLHRFKGIDLPLIAAGGIHSLADARVLLTSGAAAVQIDSLLLRDPQAAYQIALEIGK